MHLFQVLIFLYQYNWLVTAYFWNWTVFR